ncbi:TPA: superinfection exclusion B family protein [Morganella morganii subsp. morganii]|nr:superinfection exclusion B family protein [Morganella morganii subsp. morganii]
MDISAILNFLKLSKKVYIVIGVISGILLFSSEEFLIKLSLLNFKESYNLWIGVIFLLSTGMTAVLIIDSVLSFITRTIKRKSINKRKEAAKAEKKKEQAEEKVEQAKAAAKAEAKEKAKREQADAEAKAEEKRCYDEWKAHHDKGIKSLDNDEKIVLREFYIQNKNTIEIMIDNPTVLGLISKKIIRQVGNQGYSDMFTIGRVAYFSVDEHVINYFGTLDFPELCNLSRPQWLKGIEASKNYEEMRNNLSDKMIKFNKL